MAEGTDTKLGNIFGIIPARPCIMVFAALWFLVGLYHLVTASLVFFGLFAGSADPALAPSCQGTQCHDEWRQSFGTCQSEKRSTFLVRYLTVGVLGIAFGYLGFVGAKGRESPVVKSFAWFQFGMVALFAGALFADLMYVEVCGYMPTNMVRDIMPIIPPTMLDKMRAQGYSNIDALPVKKVKEAMGFDFVSAYAGALAVGLAVATYVAVMTLTVSDHMTGGPLGLGPLFPIATIHDREITAAQEKADEILNMVVNSRPHYSTFPALQDGQNFPYLSTHGSAGPSIEYGGIGAAKAHDIEDPRFKEYLGVMGL